MCLVLIPLAVSRGGLCKSNLLTTYWQVWHSSTHVCWSHRLICDYEVPHWQCLSTWQTFLYLWNLQESITSAWLWVTSSGISNLDKDKNAIQIGISGSQALYRPSWWLWYDIHQVALITRIQIFSYKLGSSSWRCSFTSEEGCFRMRAREIKRGKNERNNLGFAMVLIHHVGWQWQGNCCCLNPKTERKSGCVMIPHDNRQLNWKRHAVLAHRATSCLLPPKNKKTLRRLIKVG